MIEWTMVSDALLPAVLKSRPGTTRCRNVGAHRGGPFLQFPIVGTSGVAALALRFPSPPVSTLALRFFASYGLVGFFERDCYAYARTSGSTDVPNE